jgi:hypothetical protein
MPVGCTHFHLGHIPGMDSGTHCRIQDDQQENNGADYVQAMQAGEYVQE